MKTVELKEARYAFNMSIGGDTWTVYGITENGPVFTSTPKNFDEERDILITQNTQYHIVSYAVSKEDFKKEVLIDIENKGTRIR